jgi:PucR C-terminal helix-turn-helix domain/GGDEF-like domain
VANVLTLAAPRSDTDSQAPDWLELIELFDEALTTDEDVPAIARLAARTTQRTVAVQDRWHAIDLEINPAGVAKPGDVGLFAALTKAIATGEVRGRRAVARRVENRFVLIAAVEAADPGPIGFACLLSPASEWRPRDYLAVERLAVAVGIRAVRARSERTGSAHAPPATIERLLLGGLNEYELAEAARLARIPVDGHYLAAAFEHDPASALGAEPLAAVVEQAANGSSAVARTAIIGRTVALIASETLEAALPAIASKVQTSTSVALRIGLGEAVHLDGIASSWQQAREALTLSQLARHESCITRFSDLGILHLLAQIPEETILGSSFFSRFVSCTTSSRGNPSDLDVLEAYLEQGSLRRAAATLFLHHTTVEYRLRRIEERLDLDLSQPSARFQAHVALKLLRILGEKLRAE